MLLLDRAVKLAAEQDEPPEMNFVRKHAMQQVRERCLSLWNLNAQSVRAGVHDSRNQGLAGGFWCMDCPQWGTCEDGNCCPFVLTHFSPMFLVIEKKL